jgi:carotenoid cleavage dioxygenase-like enzyme
MKIVAVLGSPHGIDGNTGSLVNSLLEGARSAGAETEIFSLSELAVGHCTGCQTCVKTGKCVLIDDMPTITRALQEADGYVLAVIYDATTELSELMILDAESLSDEIAVVPLRNHVPHGFHCGFTPL